MQKYSLLNKLSGEILAIILLLSTASIHSQQDGWKIFKAPNENFNGFKLQTYRNLIRLGTIDESVYSTQKKWEHDYELYHKLIKAKQKIGPTDNASISREIYAVARSTISPIGRKKYSSQDGTVFDKKALNKSFLDDNLNALNNWAKQTIPNGNIEAFYITQDVIEEYDFDNEGISLTIGFQNIKDDNRIKATMLKQNSSVAVIQRIKSSTIRQNLSGGFFTQNSINSVSGDLKYTPRKSYERNLESLVIFYPVEMEKANEILLNKKVFMVRKIILNDDLTFQLASPIIELFLDKALTNKLGELHYDELIFY